MVSEPEVAAAARVLNLRLTKHDGLHGVSRDMLTAAEAVRAETGVVVNLPDKWHQFVVTSSDYGRPYLLGCYQTLDQALKAQDGKPDKWEIFARVNQPLSPARQTGDE